MREPNKRKLSYSGISIHLNAMLQNAATVCVKYPHINGFHSQIGRERDRERERERERKRENKKLGIQRIERL